MKFGRHLEDNKEPEWSDYYVDYKKLKKIIKGLSENHIPPVDSSSTTVSLSVPPPSNAAGQRGAADDVMTEEEFFHYVESEMQKIEDFTSQQVNLVVKELTAIDKEIAREGLDEDVAGDKAEKAKEVEAKVDRIAEVFLKLEKYVNLNYMAFSKILKKHDRFLPNTCKAFYMSRLHNQSWIRGDYSKAIVQMSRIYSTLRGDKSAKEAVTDTQNFVRSTTKYWVRTSDVSQVKTIILRHLPVFLQKTATGDTDSQLINSVYLDNAVMELYRGRLDKTPGAIALRFRWYGTDEPEMVFVERKTHRDSWTGEVSVKERFMVSKDEVQQILDGSYDYKKEMERMIEKGKSEEEIAEWKKLVKESIQTISAKQLVPTLRTQYMRTAFQIPFDATVRVSLDTNLCMFYENVKVGSGRWYRDPKQPVPQSEITRFPHAILEIKLQLEDESATPQWVLDLLSSGLLTEVHKFSKFIHGCAVLLQDEVPALPYWIDDESLRASIENSGAKIDDAQDNPILKQKGIGAQTRTSLFDTARRGYTRIDDIERPTILDCCDWMYPAFGGGPRMTISAQKIEPKLFFANERTFIHWIHMAVTLSSLSAAVLAFTPSESLAAIYALVLLPVAALFCGYAFYVFRKRVGLIKNREAVRWDDPVGPLIMGSSLILALSINLLIRVANALAK